jgi:cell division protein FtsW (lipid II flippase)
MIVSHALSSSKPGVPARAFTESRSLEQAPKGHWCGVGDCGTIAGMPVPAALLSLLVGAAGWYYLFYSQAARQLDQVEDSAANRWRLLLRRTNSIVLLLIAVGFYAGFASVDSHEHPFWYLVIWLFVCLLVIVAVALAVIDLRLTARLRRKL